MTGTAEAKIQQSAVKYQTEPKDGKQCSDCNFFVAPNACKQVDGNISPNRLLSSLGEEAELTKPRVIRDKRRLIGREVCNVKYSESCASRFALDRGKAELHRPNKPR